MMRRRTSSHRSALLIVGWLAVAGCSGSTSEQTAPTLSSIVTVQPESSVPPQSESSVPPQSESSVPPQSAFDAEPSPSTSTSRASQPVATPTPSSLTDAATPTCTTYRTETRGVLPDVVTELSGWALSSDGSTLWGHNDAGEGPNLIGISVLDGSLVAQVHVEGAPSRDWEDIAPYTDPQGAHWLIVADTGDNAERRDGVALVLVPEPSRTTTTVRGAGVVTVRWERGAHDVEALMVDPVSGDVVAVGKRFDDVPQVAIDVIPAASLVAGTTVTSRQVAMFAVPQGQEYGPTGAAIDPTGTRIGMVFYNDLTLLWARPQGTQVAEVITTSMPCRVASGVAQRESLAMAADGTVFVSREGAQAPLIALAP